MMYVPVLLSAAIVEKVELIWCVVGGVLICLYFHVVGDVSMVSMAN